MDDKVHRSTRSAWITIRTRSTPMCTRIVSPLMCTPPLPGQLYGRPPATTPGDGSKPEKGKSGSSRTISMAGTPVVAAPPSPVSPYGELAKRYLGVPPPKQTPTQQALAPTLSASVQPMPVSLIIETARRGERAPFSSLRHKLNYNVVFQSKVSQLFDITSN